MASEPDQDQLLRRAEEIFLARSLISDEARPHDRGPIFGVAELVRFLADPNATLSPEQSRALFVDRRLADSFRALRRRASVDEMPAMAAASDGELTERSFPGGSLRFRPGGFDGQVTLTVRLREEWTGPLPRQLMLFRPSTGEVCRVQFSSPADDLILMEVLDTGNAAHSQALDMLRDPMVEGSFLK